MYYCTEAAQKGPPFYFQFNGVGRESGRGRMKPSFQQKSISQVPSTSGKIRMKDAYAGSGTKFHSLSLTMFWLTCSGMKCAKL